MAVDNVDNFAETYDEERFLAAHIGDPRFEIDPILYFGDNFYTANSKHTIQSRLKFCNNETEIQQLEVMYFQLIKKEFEHNQTREKINDSSAATATAAAKKRKLRETNDSDTSHSVASYPPSKKQRFTAPTSANGSDDNDLGNSVASFNEIRANYNQNPTNVEEKDDINHTSATVSSTSAAAATAKKRWVDLSLSDNDDHESKADNNRKNRGANQTNVDKKAIPKIRCYINPEHGNQYIIEEACGANGRLYYVCTKCKACRAKKHGILGAKSVLDREEMEYQAQLVKKSERASTTHNSIENSTSAAAVSNHTIASTIVDIDTSIVAPETGLSNRKPIPVKSYKDGRLSGPILHLSNPSPPINKDDDDDDTVEQLRVEMREIDAQYEAKLQALQSINQKQTDEIDSLQSEMAEYKQQTLCLEDSLYKYNGDRMETLDFSKSRILKKVWFIGESNTLIWTDANMNNTQSMVVTGLILRDDSISQAITDSWFLLRGSERIALFVSDKIEVQQKFTNFIEKSLSAQLQK